MNIMGLRVTGAVFVCALIALVVCADVDASSAEESGLVEDDLPLTADDSGISKRATMSSAFRYGGIGKRSMGEAMRYIGIGKRGSMAAGYRFAGIGKRQLGASLKYIGLGKRGPTSIDDSSLESAYDILPSDDDASPEKRGMASSFRFAGIGKRGFSASPNFRFAGVGKRGSFGSNVRYIGLGKRDGEEVDDYAPLLDYYREQDPSSAAKRWNYWSSRRTRIDPAYRLVGIGRK